MKISKLYTGKLFVKTYCFRIDNERLAVVDPGGTDEELLEHLKLEAPKKISILLTHGHFDHVGGVGGLLELFPEAKIYIHKNDSPYLGKTGITEHLKCFAAINAERYIEQYEKEYGNFPEPTNILQDNDEIYGFKVMHTPGHTPGSVCFYNKAKKILFSGDTLFYHSYGRTDLYGGNDKDMVDSLKRVLSLPSDTEVFTGHGQNTTIGAEQKALARFL